jgi:LysM repeat protein
MKWLLIASLCVMLLASSKQASAFTHIVQKGDTLASLAEKYYGRIQYEKILVAANALDAHGGTAIAPGMRLEVPALSHRRVRKGETWDELAEELLGSEHRSDVLSIANGSSPWLIPAEGTQIVVPYNLRVIIQAQDSLVNLAYKYLGDRNKAWILDRYNKLKGRKLRQGDAILIALTDLPLTEAGKRSARLAAGLTCTEASGMTREVQKRVETELPALIADVRAGRYVDAISRGNRFVAMGSLTRTQLAVVNRQLLEAYAALDATGLATAACDEWRKHDAQAKLDENLLSPKLIAACKRGRAP